MAKNTSILLGDYFEQFIAKEIASGRYQSVSEVVRTALRLLENEEKKLEALRQALIEGENSGVVENFDPSEHLKQIHSKRA